VTSATTGRLVSGGIEPETTVIRNMNPSTAYFHSAIMNATVKRRGFVGNFIPKEKKDYLCSHVTDSGWKNIMHFYLETRDFQ
jgi:predicted methyltransferase